MKWIKNACQDILESLFVQSCQGLAISSNIEWLRRKHKVGIIIMSFHIQVINTVFLLKFQHKKNNIIVWASLKFLETKFNVPLIYSNIMYDNLCRKLEIRMPKFEGPYLFRKNYSIIYHRLAFCSSGNSARPKLKANISYNEKHYCKILKVITSIGSAMMICKALHFWNIGHISHTLKTSSQTRCHNTGNTLKGITKPQSLSCSWTLPLTRKQSGELFFG